MKNRKKLAVACAATLGFILGIGGTNAYLTSYDQVVNVVGIGKNTTNIVEEFPTPSPLPGDEDSEFPKQYGSQMEMCRAKRLRSTVM